MNDLLLNMSSMLLKFLFSPYPGLLAAEEVLITEGFLIDNLPKSDLKMDCNNNNYIRYIFFVFSVLLFVFETQ
jgi:hypothetical protein